MISKNSEISDASSQPINFVIRTGLQIVFTLLVKPTSK